MNRTVPTKLRVPEIETRLILRPHLMRLLDEGLRRKLTLVSAPAGYGKTTSVATWTRALGDRSFQSPHLEVQPPVSTAWYSLDPEDDNLSTFFTRFTAAIEAALPSALRAVATGLDLEAMPAEQYANALAEACLELPHPVVLVLDDYHLIAQPGIHAVLLHLIQYASDKLHLVIMTRHDPPLRIARLRAQNQVAEVRSANLRLTEQETEELLEIRLAKRQPAELVATLHARTEGWLAGLQLAATAIRGVDDPAEFASDLQRHDTPYVMDYLFDEVMAHQGKQVEEFLLKTALLVRFNAELAAEVTRHDIGTCQRIISQLSQENLFVVALDSEHIWFRYHRQFRAMLVDRARMALSADVINALRGDAADWLAGNGWIDEALAEYVADKRWQKAADLVESDRYRLQDREEWQLLWRRISQLPDEVVAQRPGLLLAQAWLLQVHDRHAAIPPVVERAEVLMASTGSTASAMPWELLLGEIHALRGSWIFPQTPGEQRIKLLYQALSLLPAGRCAWVRGFAYIQLAYHLCTQRQSQLAYQQIWHEIGTAGLGAVNYLTRLHHALAVIAYRNGALSELHQIGLRYRELAAQSKMPMAMAWSQLALGWVYYHYCESEQAWEALLPIFGQLHDVHLETAVLALTALIPVAAELGRGDQADELIEQVRRLAIERESVATVDELQAMAAHAALLCQDRKTALAWAQGFTASGFRSITGQRRDPRVSTRVLTFAKIVLALESRPLVSQAIEILQAYIDLCEARGNMGQTVEGAVLLACCCAREGRSVQALAWMQRAVDFGVPRGFRRVFFEQGADVAGILYTMIQHDMSADAASRLLAGYGTWQARRRSRQHHGDHVGERAIIPLSEREVEVLALLAERLTNKEIARQLSISSLTVRNHTSSIYGKLNVTSRRQAVAQAQVLGLLPPSPDPQPGARSDSLVR